MIDSLWMTRNQGVVHVLNEEALVVIVEVTKKAGFNGALLHSNVL